MLVWPAIAALLATSPAFGEPAPVRAAWVELAPSGPIVRAIADGAACPRVAALARADALPGWTSVMAVRADPAPPAFPNRVCEWSPPPDATHVAVEGHADVLRMPEPNPHRIVVLGDSGCQGGTAQDCEHDWYFPRIAALAAARRPDLVIHVGDYNYRGTTCVAYDACCTYNPVSCGFPDCGDSWATWWQDFFAPAAPLLAAAPWVMVRGNHELCSRAGRGFFRYLDPHSPPPPCNENPVIAPTFTNPYPLSLGASLRFVVMDSANACGQLAERDEVPQYAREFALMRELLGDSDTPTWWLSHRPLWGVLRTVGGPMVLNYTLEQASGSSLPPSITLLISGHEHLFQAVTMRDPALPPQLVVGTGGAVLDDPQQLPDEVTDLPIGPGEPTIARATSVYDHGYLLIERRDDGTWTASFHDIYDQPLATCMSSQRPAICTRAR
jgi:hypothetical protein